MPGAASRIDSSQTASSRELLEVVQHQQHLLVPQEGDHLLSHGEFPGWGSTPDRWPVVAGRYSEETTLASAMKNHAVGKASAGALRLSGDLLGRLNGKACFARAAQSGQGQQATATIQESLHESPAAPFLFPPTG